MQATRGAHSPNLQVAITHVRHVYSQLCLDFYKERMECRERNRITRVWTFYNLLMESDHA